MNISDDTKNVVSFLNSATNGKIKRIEDLSLILEIGATEGLSQEINDLIFIGASIYKLSEALKNNELVENSNLIKKELANNIIEIKKILNQLDNYLKEDQDKSKFQSYLNENENAFVSIIELSQDLFELKNLQNKFS